MTKTNSYINKLLKITLIGCLAIIAIAIQSCTSKQRNEGTAYDDIMRWLDDSIAALAPSAPQAIEHGMREANDSITYYEYKLRMAMYYSLTDHPERADTLIKNVKAFAARQDDGFYAVNGTCASPRLNSLMAGAKACEAARDTATHDIL